MCLIYRAGEVHDAVGRGQAGCGHAAGGSGVGERPAVIQRYTNASRFLLLRLCYSTNLGHTGRSCADDDIYTAALIMRRSPPELQPLKAAKVANP